MEDQGYRHIIDRLAQHEPQMSEKTRLVNEIMSRIQPKPTLAERIDDMLFDWVKSIWWRTVMTGVCVMLLGLFIFQQMELDHKVSNIENQLMSKMDASQPMGSQSGVAQKALVNLILRDHTRADSVKIARHDLEAILSDYLEVLEENKKLKGLDNQVQTKAISPDKAL